MYVNRYISHEAATNSYNIFFEAVLFLFCLASIFYSFVRPLVCFFLNINTSNS